MSLASPRREATPLPTPREERHGDTEASLQAPGLAAFLESNSPARRLFSRLAIASLLLAVLIPGGFWAYYQAGHLVTRNALVRSHLSDLGLRVEGVVSEVLVAAGDSVKRGDVLARLDDTHLQAQRSQAAAALAALEERIAAERLALDLAHKEVVIALATAEARYARRRAEAEAARVQADEAAAVYASRKALGPDGAISAEKVRESGADAARQSALADASGAATTEAQAQLEAARLAREALAVREAELQALAATRLEAAATLQRVEADIASTELRAPADGAVVRRLAQPGMAVGPGTPVISLWLDDDTWIEAWIPEESLGALSEGSRVSVSFPALPGQRFAGEVGRVGLATDFEMPLDYLPQTREMRMRPTPQVGVLVRLDAAPELMRPGMSAVVDISRGGA